MNVRMGPTGPDFRTALELAGLEIPETLAGLALVPNHGPWPVVAELRHDEIWWRFAREQETDRPSPKPSRARKTLDAFARVSSPASAVSFVRRFGPLGLCWAHGLPECIPCGYWPGRGAFPRAPAARDADGTEYYVESLDGYLFFARFARAVLRIAAQLKRGEPRAPEDWETVDELVEREAQREPVLGPYVTTLGRMRTNLGSSGEWLALVFALNLLAMRCRARPSCTPQADYSKHGLRITGVELGIEPDAFGAIGFQLINTVARGKEIYLCSYCGRPYVPKRRPNPNRRNFCDDCRAQGIPARLRRRDCDQRKMARQQAARHQSAEGSYG